MLWGCFPSPSLSVASPDWFSSLGLHNPGARPHCAAHFWQQTVPESKATQWEDRVVSLKSVGVYQKAKVLIYHY